MGEYSIVDLIKKLQEKQGYEGIIELLESNKNSEELKSIKYDDGDTPLCIAIKNTALWKQLSPEDKNSLIEKSDVDYVYNGPLDKTMQKVIGDSYLHTAAKARNTDAFVFVCKKNIALVTQQNDNGNNPFHEAARCRILLPVVKKVLDDIRSEAKKEISKAKEVEEWEKSKKLEKELNHKEKYIRDALRSKSCTSRKDRKTPLACLYVRDQEELKQIAGIKDSFICNKKLHASLYIVGAIICVTALCLSLYFLFLASATFALSSITSIAVGGTGFLLLRACSEVFKLSEEGTVDNVFINNYKQEMEVC